MTYHWSVSLQANRQSNQANLLSDLPGLLDGWSSGGHGTLPRRLAHALRRSIQSGLIAPGTRVPAERHLAEALSISRATVTQALDELRGAGMLESTPGRGTFVVAPALDSPAGTRVAEHLSGLHGIDLATGNPPDPSHLPPIQLDVGAMLAQGGGPGMYPLGLPAMREAVAEHLRRTTGRHTDAEQVHVTSGAHQAMALMVGCLTGPTRPLVVEQPNYPGIFDIADGLGTEVIAVRGDEAGIDPEALERVVRDRNPAAIYVQAGPHNPTGRVARRVRVERIADIVDRAGMTVIEDNTLGPLAFDGRPHPQLADLCRTATVVSVGSMSKVAWAGLRIGWLVAPAPLVDRSMFRRLGHDLGASVPSQLLAMALLPHFDEIAAARRIALAQSVGRAIDHIQTVLPEARFTPPDGGSVIWVALPIDDSNALVHLAARHGVHVAPGSISMAGRVPGPFVRICVDRPWDAAREGLDRLGRAWRELRTTRPPILG
jgi:DNA-binding transcriptional MocR family regulator